jgi:cytochrome c biogenesis protein CcmG/thiol:disulfide interchange protein DsbE
LLSGGGALALGAIVLVALAGTGTGVQAPALPRRALHPPAVTLATLRGEPAIVHFWASWCGSCSKEAPQLAALSRELRGRARLVAVDYSDNPQDAAAFIGRYHWDFPVLADEDGVSGSAYGLVGLPATFVLDARGRIVARMSGPQNAASVLARLPAP